MTDIVQPATTKTFVQLLKDNTTKALAILAMLGTLLPTLLPGHPSLVTWYTAMVLLLGVGLHALLASPFCADVRPGWKTGSFWAALVTIVAAVAASAADLQVPGHPGVSKYAGIIVALLASAGYSAVRAKTKDSAFPSGNGGAAVSLLVLVGFCSSLAVTPGCATISPLLPTAIVYVQDATLVLETIDTFVKAYFSMTPDPTHEVKVENAIARARSALDAALRIIHGSQKLDDAQIDAAFADFKVAYTDLLTMTDFLGVHPIDRGQVLAKSQKELQVPEPLIMVRLAAHQAAASK